MNKSVFISLLLAAGSVDAATYQFSSDNYNILSNYGGCSGPLCGNYTNSMKITGVITTSITLQPSTTYDKSVIVAYSFSDGINSYDSSDPSTYLSNNTSISIDGGGNIQTGSTYISVYRWLTGTNGFHVGTDHISAVWFHPGGSLKAYNNAVPAMNINPPDGQHMDSDSLMMNAFSSSAEAPNYTASLISTSIESVPALSDVTLGALISGVLLLSIRKRKNQVKPV